MPSVGGWEILGSDPTLNGGSSIYILSLLDELGHVLADSADLLQMRCAFGRQGGAAILDQRLAKTVDVAKRARRGSDQKSPLA